MSTDTFTTFTDTQQRPQPFTSTGTITTFTDTQPQQRSMYTDTITTITDTQQRPQPFTSTSALSLSHNIETMLIKQGKQIRALYELQKATFERVSSIQN
jgi:hypothetical protein